MSKKQVEAWNEANPPGTEVILTDDYGGDVVTKTRSVAWLLGGHTPVVSVEGRNGGYLLDRLRPSLMHPCDCGEGFIADPEAPGVGPSGPDPDCEDCHGTGLRNAIEYWRTSAEREHERAEVWHEAALQSERLSSELLEGSDRLERRLAKSEAAVADWRLWCDADGAPEPMTDQKLQDGINARIEELETVQERASGLWAKLSMLATEFESDLQPLAARKVRALLREALAVGEGQ